MDEPGLTAVKVAATRLQRVEERQDTAVDELARAARAAFRMGVPEQRVAEAAGLTRRTLDDVLRRGRT